MIKILKKYLKQFYHFVVGKKQETNTIERFVPLVKEFLGKKLYIHDIASFNLCNEELFQLEMYKFKASRPNPFIIDCGANLGMSVIYFKQLYPDASIIAFEADDYIFSFLEKNVESFGYEDVELINKAVWNSDETLSFIVEGGAGGRIEEETSKGKYKKSGMYQFKKIFDRKKSRFFKNRY